jgi:predicted NUDIX family phosphoesterase
LTIFTKNFNKPFGKIKEMIDIKKIRNLIETGMIESALNEVIFYLNTKHENSVEKRIFDEVILHKSSFIEQSKLVNNGLIRFDEAEKVRNRIILSVLNIVNELEVLAKDEIIEFENKYEKKILTDENLTQYYSNESLLEISYKNIKIAPCILLYDNSERKLPLSAFNLVVDKVNHKFLINNQIKGRSSQLIDFNLSKNHNLFNSSTIRLNDLNLSDDHVDLIVSKANYFDYLGTNYSLDIKLEGWNKTLRELVHSKNKLCSINESQLSNHIGIGVLVFTSDGFLVLQKRSQKGVSIYHSKISPSISGASEFKDIREGVRNSIKTLILREGEEEIGIDEDDYDDNSINFLGITRELNRGGKPEIFFSAQLKINTQELIYKSRFAKDRSESQSIELIEFEPLNLKRNDDSEYYDRCHLETVNSLFETYKDNISPPLSANLALWIKYRMSK